MRKRDLERSLSNIEWELRARREEENRIRKELRRSNGTAMYDDLTRKEKLAVSKEKSLITSTITVFLFGSFGLLYSSPLIAIIFFLFNFYLYYYVIDLLTSANVYIILLDGLHLRYIISTFTFEILIIRVINAMVGIFMTLNFNAKVRVYREQYREHMKKLGWEY